jgi:[NiFe] hydrogenase assembly HybE family chaperone
MAEGGHIAPEQSDRVRALVTSFERIARNSMYGLPFYNDALAVEAVGFECFGDGWIGVLITPWFMNLVFLSERPIPYSEAANGKKRTAELPGGPVTFLCGGAEDVGMFEAHSIASPMAVYKSQDQARAAARQALLRLRTPLQAEPRAPLAQPVVSRRNLFSFARRPLSSESSS